MVISKHEHELAAVQRAEQVAEGMDDVVRLLKEHPEGMTCKDLGNRIYGEHYSRYPVKEAYNDRNKRHWNNHAQSLAVHLGHLLSILVREGYVERKKEKTDEPVMMEGEVLAHEVLKWVECGEPYTVTAWDAKGRAFEVHNPDWHSPRRQYVIETVYKTRTSYIWKGKD